MKRTTSLILAFAFCLVLLFGIAPTAGAETTEAEFSEGYIKVSSNHETKLYRAITDGKDIFMLPEDIAHICGYTKIVYYKPNGETANLIEFVRKKWEEIYGSDSLTVSYFQKEQIAISMRKEYYIETHDKNGLTYFPLFQMMYLFHAQWCKEDGVLIVEPLKDTIVDFVIENYSEIEYGQAKQIDLLINGESMWDYSIKSAFALVFNDFDPYIFVPYWPGEGWFPAVTTEIYKKALLQIAVDDDRFLDSDSQKRIEKLANSSNPGLLPSELESLKTILETPEKVNNVTDWIIDLVEKKTSLKFNPYYDISNPEIKARAQELGDITDLISIINISFETAEVTLRSKDWGMEYIKQLEYLTRFDDNDITIAANSLLNEYRDSISAAVDTAVKGAVTLFLDKFFDLTIFGKFFAIFKTGIAVSKINETVKSELDARDLSSKVEALIFVESDVIQELHNLYDSVIMLSYADADAPSASPGTLTQDMLQDLRTCTTLALRTDIRNWTNIYDINQILNEEFNKWSVQNGLKIKNRIWRDYALLCLLMETERYDRLLILDSFDQMFSDEYGKMREDISPDDLIWASANPAERVPGAFESFISSREYLKYKYHDKSYAKSEDSSFVYAVCLHDIDQDGVEELILEVDSDQNPFSPSSIHLYPKYYVLKYDEEMDQFTEIGSIYDWATLHYSEPYKSLVQDGEGLGGADIFFTIENGAVKALMYVGEEWDSPYDMSPSQIFFEDDEGNRRLISENEYQAYFEGMIALDFTFLNGQYSGVMRDSETNQPLEGVAIELTYRMSEDEDSEQKEIVWSGADGAFTVSTPSEATEVREITFSAEGYAKKKISLIADHLNMTDLGTLSMSRFPSAEGMEELGLILYRSILDNHYQQILNGWTEADSLEINPLFYYRYAESNYPKVTSLSEAGYAFLDLDDNGIPELILTTTEGASSGSIYDLYTWWDGKAIKLVSSLGVRVWYWLGEDGHIYTHASGGAAFYVSEDLKVIDDKLIYSRLLREYWGDYHYGDSAQLKVQYSIEDEDIVVYAMESISQERYYELLDDFFTAPSWDIPLTTFDHYKP